MQLIEREANLVPRLIERHHVLVRVDGLLDVLVVVVSLDQVVLLGFDLVHFLFGPELIKTGSIHV